MVPRRPAGRGRLALRRAALLLALPLAAGCTPPGAGAPGPRAPAGAAPTPAPEAVELERQIHERVNRYRAERGLSPLRYDPRIADAARAHSAAMAAGTRSFGHGFLEQRAAQLRAQGIPIGGMGENVALDSRVAALAEHVVTGWIRSTGHRANLAGAYHLTGVGVARSSDGPFYVTQIYVTER